ncbi:MAG: cytochrome C biogenesis protein [Acidobacteria bacterium]|nr:MAG: cytochrome C biogenesis protein [Acidobacteriota bacterium]
MKLLARILPWAMLALFLAEILAAFIPNPDTDIHLREFGRLPVLMNGRVQPFDSAARNSLLQIRGTTDVPLEEVPSWQFWRHGKKLSACEWLLELLTKPDLSNQRPVFLIHNPELLRTLQLDEQGVERSGLRYYTYSQVDLHSEQIEDLGSQFENIGDTLRSPYQSQLLKLRNALTLYRRLQLSLQPPGAVDLASVLSALEQAAPAGMAALRARAAGEKYDAAALSRFRGPANGFLAVANSALPLVIPPRDPQVPGKQWVNFGVGVLSSLQEGKMHPAARWFALSASAYSRGDAAEFNAAVEGYRQWLRVFYPNEYRKGRAEFYFNEVQAFLHAIIIYLTAFLLSAGALLALAVAPNLADSLRRSSARLIGLALVVHTFGLVFRMALEGRPPVTNLYSSAIFVGWGAVVLGLVLEHFFKVGLGCAVASLSGFITLIIAHNLAVGGDTMEMLRAVLDTNFWLATHVTTVTLGYSSTFVAGLLGIAYVFLGLLTPILSQKLGARDAAAQMPAVDVREGQSQSGDGKMVCGKALGKMMYGVVCFATLFSFVGTMLGGIWADQSWGRFWGWDPKENGALIIVLWNALILHARWGGFVRERGLALLCIAGNIVTSFSWFGVNMLGIGLHSYGFMDAAFKWLMLFVVTQLVIVGLGLVPLRYWLSFRASVGIPKRGQAPRMLPALPPDALRKVRPW